jgi:hypothetical protein
MMYDKTGVPMGFAKTVNSRWTVDENKRFVRLPALTRYLFSLSFWSKDAVLYDITRDEWVSGRWRLIVRLRYARGEGLSIRKGWALEKASGWSMYVAERTNE